MKRSGFSLSVRLKRRTSSPPRAATGHSHARASVRRARFVIMKLLLLAALSYAFTGCSYECIDDRSFSSREFQQTWFISETPGMENLGAAFGDNGGTFYKPLRIREFDYCAMGNKLHIEHGDIIKRRVVVEVLELNNEKMLLKFPGGETFEYFRAGR